MKSKRSELAKIRDDLDAIPKGINAEQVAYKIALAKAVEKIATNNMADVKKMAEIARRTLDRKKAGIMEPDPVDVAIMEEICERNAMQT